MKVMRKMVMNAASVDKFALPVKYGKDHRRLGFPKVNF